MEAISENGISKDLNYWVECQRRAISHSYVLLAATVSVPPAEEFLWLSKKCRRYQERTADMTELRAATKEQAVFLTSQLISISWGKWPSILIFSGFLSGAVEVKEYRFCCRYCVGETLCWADAQARRRTTKIKSIIWQVRAFWRILYKHVISNKRKTAGPDGGVLYLSEGSLNGPIPTSLTPDTRKR